MEERAGARAEPGERQSPVQGCHIAQQGAGLHGLVSLPCPAAWAGPFHVHACRSREAFQRVQFLDCTLEFR